MARRNLSQRSELIHDVNHFGINADTNELFLFGNYEADGCIDFGLASVFIKNLRLLEKQTNSIILIHFRSDGGYLSDGFAIYDAIKSCKCETVILCYGLAASMGAIIPQAATYRVIMPNADMMIHYGQSGGAVLDAIASNSFSEFYIKQQQRLIDVLTERCKMGPHFKGWSENKVKNFIDRKLKTKQDWWLTARESVEYGLMDAVLGDSGYETIDNLKG